MKELILEKAILLVKDDLIANKTDGMLNRIETLLQESRACGKDKLIGNALLNKASYLRRSGNFDLVIKCIEEALTCFKNSKEFHLEAMTLNELGTTYLDLGQDDKGITCFFSALDILNEKKTYDITRASIMNNLGTAYYDREDYGKAKTFFIESYELLLLEASVSILPIITFNIAECSFYLGDIEESKKFLAISSKVSEEASDESGAIFSALLQEVISYEESMIIDPLIEYFHKTQKLMEGWDVAVIVELGYIYCQTLYRHKEWQTLKLDLEEVYQYALSMDVQSVIVNIRKMLKETYIGLGDYQSAYAILEAEMESVNEKVKTIESKKYNQVEKDYKQISNQYHVDQLEDSVRIFKLLSEVGYGITLNKDIQGIFEYIVAHIYSIWDLDLFGVAVIEETNQIKYHYNTLKEGVGVETYSRWNKSLLMTYCINNKKEFVINDTNEDIDYKKEFPQIITDKIKASTVRSIIFTPMYDADEVIGAITIQSNNSYYFNSGAIEVARTFAAYCATAIINHKRHLKLSEMKDLDGLTGAYNRHALINYNTIIESGTEKNILPIFIGMLDIDYFKQYNDHYGHVAGDECIVAVATMLADKVYHGGGDLFRYGGDEFSIVIKNCNKEAAESLLRLLLETLDTMNLVHEYSHVSNKVTLSIGGIILNSIDQKFTEYYKDVDKILYEVKKQGRNGYKVVNIGSSNQ